jgi:glyoxylase-like metal-dependent hydrolase (beta-lactamase superfamily II)
LPPTELLRPGLWSIGVPFPDNPLGYTLVYLIESDRGPVLVDAGWDDDESWAALEAGFRVAGHDVADCYGVLVTHVHPDHHGLSGRVREASDAWVAMHERDAVTVEHISSGMARERRSADAAPATMPDFTDEASDAWVAMHERDAVTVEHISSGMARERRSADAAPATMPDFTDELMAVLLDAGATEDELAAAPAPQYRRRARRFRPLAVPDRAVDDGERVDVPGWDIRAIWTPGHTPGHLCFHAPEHRLLLSGDHVLGSITPHISISRRDRGGDPLGDFLDSLQKIAHLDPDEVLPAHRNRFTDLPARVDEITRHHLEHLTDIEAVLDDGPASLWQIAARLRWNRPWEEFPLGLRRSAVNETAAHLRYLTRRDRAVRFKGVRPFTFARPEGTPPR